MSPPPSASPTPSRFCHPVREVAATRTFGSTLGASKPARRPSSRPAPRVCLSPAWLGLLGPSTWSYLSPPFLRCSFFKGPCDSKATSLPSFVSWRADLLLKRAILYPLTRECPHGDLRTKFAVDALLHLYGKHQIYEQRERSEKLLFRGGACRGYLGPYFPVPSPGPNALTVQEVSSEGRFDFRQGLWDAALSTSDILFWENDSIRQGAHNTAGAPSYLLDPLR